MIEARAVIATWFLEDYEEQDAFTAGEEVVRALQEAGLAIVPIKPSERMVEELARIGDGPMISGEECWGYMLAAAMADSVQGG